jgi:sugar lactone lactonase YvrE
MCNSRSFKEVVVKKMRSVWLGLCLVVLAAASCDSPGSSQAGVDGGGAGDGTTSDSGPSAFGLELFAGAIGVAGAQDGTGIDARFDGPAGVAVDSAGNIYVADVDNFTIRKITPAGVVTTLAGTAGMFGSADGTGAAARFSFTQSVAVDSAGNVYVADSFNFTIRKVTPTGVVTTLAGTAGMPGSVDGIGAAARFSSPDGVAVDSASNVYVADDPTIRKVTPAGVVTTLAGSADAMGSADGTGADARFLIPNSLAVDSAGNVYVADEFNFTIRKVTPTGVVTTLAGTAGMRGSADGTGGSARFDFPHGVAVDSAGNVYVADTHNSTVRKITPAGVTTTIAGTPGMTGILLGATPRLDFPRSLAIVGDSIIIADDNSILLLRHGVH